MNLAQTRVIAELSEALPADLGDDLLAKAETLLVAEAATSGRDQALDWNTLLADLGTAGVAVTSTGDKLTADQARRLACQAWIRLRRQVADRRHLVPVINQSTACSRCGSEATRHGTPGECVTPHLGSR